VTLSVATALAASSARSQTPQFDQCVTQGTLRERSVLKRAFPSGPLKLVGSMMELKRKLTDEEASALAAYSAIALECVEISSSTDDRDAIRNRVFLLDLLTSRRLQVSQYAVLVWNQNKLIADAYTVIERRAKSSNAGSQ
jgi:hypothetical protein